MGNYNLVFTPLVAHFKLSSEFCPQFEVDIEKIPNVPYSTVVCSLIYVILCTRLGPSYAISMVSRCMHNPGKDHWVKCIFRYVKVLLIKGCCLIEIRRQLIMLQGSLILIMVAILIEEDIFLTVCLLFMWALSRGKHHFSLL